MKIDLAKVFLKTKEILIKKNLTNKCLWPEPEGISQVDCVLPQSIDVTEDPGDCQVNFNVDNSESTGISIRFEILLCNTQSLTPYKFDFGTIHIKSNTRETLVAYADLGANFAYYARQELEEELERVFPFYQIHYGVYSLTDEENAAFTGETMDYVKLNENMATYAPQYKKIVEGEFNKSKYFKPSALCSYLYCRAMLEGSPILTDASILTLTIKKVDSLKAPEKHSYIVCDIYGEVRFVQTDFHTYLLEEVRDE